MKKNEAIKAFIRQYGDLSKLDGNHYNGGLYLSNTQITSLPEGLTVGGSLYLSNTQITSLPEGLTVGGSLYLSNTQITSLPEGLTVGGSLDLRGTQITSLPEGLTVGGSLDLRGTQITSLPEGLTVGGSLDLSDTQITSLPEGLTVGGSLYLSGTSITDTSNVNRNVPNPMHWEYKGREYIKTDGIFSQVVAHKGNVWHIRQIGSDKVQYLVTDGEGRWAHGDSIQQARADLVYKISERNTDKYEGMTLDTRLTFAEAVECYRVITGACEAGTRGFVQSLGNNVKDHYTIAEMMEVTKGQYGNDTFCQFFSK